MPLRVDAEDCLVIIQQHRRWVTQILTRLTVDQKLSLRFPSKVYDGNLVTTLSCHFIHHPV